MVVDVRLAAVLLVDVPVGNMHVLHGGMVVRMGVGGEEMSPVLSLMEVVRHVVVLVAMLQGVVLMTSPLPRHPRSPLPWPRLRLTVHPFLRATHPVDLSGGIPHPPLGQPLNRGREGRRAA